MAIPQRKQLELSNHLPVSYEELRGKSYSDWHSARKSIMRGLFDTELAQLEPIFIEDTNCLFCEKKEFNELFLKENFTFVECVNCGLVQVNPLPRHELVDLFYNSKEYDNFVERHMTQKSGYRKTRFGNERVEVWESYLGKSTSKNTLRSLDVGCGSGFVLEAAKDRGWDSYGIDLNRKAVESGKKKNLNIYNYKLEDLSSETLGQFDVLTMYDVLEHSYDPKAMVTASRELLKPNGLLVIYVPNWDSLARLTLGVDTFWIWGIFHLSYFTVQTLSNLVSEEGFCLLNYETQGLDIADIVWWYENERDIDSQILKDNLENFQFSCNAAGLGAGLRLFAKK